MSASRKTPHSVLIVRLGAMGDVIHTMYAVSALRAALPQLKIGWTVEERWAELLCARDAVRSGAQTPRQPLVDFVHEVNTKKWRRDVFASETRKDIKGAFRQIREQQYDVAADFQGSMKSALAARFAGARRVVGMDHPREAPARFFYTSRVETCGAHVIVRYHSVAEAVAGTTLPNVMLELPHDDTAESSITTKLGGFQDRIAILNPGAGWAAKQWPAERYGEVARALAQDGLKPIVNFGPGEQDLANAVQSASNGTARLLSCSIGELIALCRRARIFIGGDTGPLHLAAALKVPVVAIFGPTDPARNGPYGTKSIVLRHPESRTSLSHISAPDAGVMQITSGEVIRAACELLEDSHG